MDAFSASEKVNQSDVAQAMSTYETTAHEAEVRENRCCRRRGTAAEHSTRREKSQNQLPRERMSSTKTSSI
jgi:hypothetical protein